MKIVIQRNHSFSQRCIILTVLTANANRISEEASMARTTTRVWTNNSLSAWQSIKTGHILAGQTVKWLAVFRPCAFYTGPDMPHFNSRFSQRGAN